MASSTSLACLLALALLVSMVAGQELSHCTEDRNVVYYSGEIDFSTPYATNQNRLLDILKDTRSDSFIYTSVGDAPYIAYGRAECYGNCGNCLVEARNTIKNAVPQAVGARLCTDDCYLRFENYSF
ncbi:putative cysteine-rich repeat secretory protein 61 [Selaginella moellendorffii]|uniref:putative cysteine-rich repeat secretory protein 61 n=1 Tax=Selaginella moellendorffii TaxID=88036 RepID=UPI000D1CA0F3|nr:putative cysteine-rich repeat secretory protein 61 [Selaginella moellendorffii]|eukprot:XP_024517285.1 putative cysteine-rich repeat secretory protein 61 [Selaginella moellendorffii]